MFEAIERRASFMLLALSFFVLIGTSTYLFNPSASWNILLENIEAPAPELQPRLDTSQITEFFDQLPSDQLRTYVFYEGFVDALYYLSNAAFFLILLGLALKRAPGFGRRFTWLLTLPFLILGFEILEAVTLLSIAYWHPQAPMIWLHVSDFSTLGKMVSYLATFIAGLLALFMLVWSFIPKRA